VAARDTEETLLAPIGVPAVRHGPVLLAVLYTEADDLDCVATLGRLLLLQLVVDAAPVVHEASG